MKQLQVVRWSVATLFLALAAGSLLAGAARGRLRRVEVAGDSMRPALAPGDFLLLRAGAPAPERAAGTVVAFEAPQAPPEALVAPRPDVMLKRVIGLPGEMLRVGLDVEVNGRILDEPHRSGLAAESSYRGVHAVPAGHYFVLGDQRSESTDSREFGAIAADRILGEAIWCYWPPGRFGRIRASERRWQAARRAAS